MGVHVNGRILMTSAWTIAAAISAMNIFLIYQQFFMSQRAPAAHTHTIHAQEELRFWPPLPVPSPKTVPAARLLRISHRQPAPPPIRVRLDDFHQSRTNRVGTDARLLDLVRTSSDCRRP